MQIDRVDLGKTPTVNDFERNLEKSFQRLMDQLVQILTKGLLFSDNFSCYIGDVTTDETPGVESGIAHGLKRIPTGYIVIGKDKTGDIFNGATAWTVSTIYLKSSVASLTAKIMIF